MQKKIFESMPLSMCDLNFVCLQWYFTGGGESGEIVESTDFEISRLRGDSLANG